MEVLDGDDVSEVSIMGASNCTMLCLGVGGREEMTGEERGKRGRKGGVRR